MSIKYKSAMIMFMMLLLVIIGGVSATDVNQTSDALSQDESDETISSENQDLLSGDDSFTDLQDEINAKDNVILDRNYTFNDTKDQTIIINKDITIDGNGHAIDANGKSNIFFVNTTTVTLKNLIFINGNSTNGGAILFNNNQTAILENCKFINTESVNGAFHFTGGDLTIRDCEFINSTAFGAEYDVEIDTETGDPRVDISPIGQSILYVNATGKITVSKSKFKNTKLSAYAIKIDDAATVDFNDNVFDDNHGIIWDAEIIGSQEAILKIKSTGCVGDLISINAGNAALTNNNFTNNEVSSLIKIQNANVSMENVEIADSIIHNAIMMNNTDNVNLNGLSISNVQCAESDCLLKIQSNEVSVNDLSVEDSLLGGGSDSSIKIVSNTTITVNNWNFNNISKAKGVNSTYFNDEHQKYVYDYKEE